MLMADLDCLFTGSTSQLTENLRTERVFVKSSFRRRCASTEGTCCKASQSETLEILTTRRLILDLLGTAEETGSAGSNETSLLSLDGVSGDGRSLSDMLMVTL